MLQTLGDVELVLRLLERFVPVFGVDGAFLGIEMPVHQFVGRNLEHGLDDLEFTITVVADRVEQAALAIRPGFIEGHGLAISRGLGIELHAGQAKGTGVCHQLGCTLEGTKIAKAVHGRVVEGIPGFLRLGGFKLNVCCLALAHCGLHLRPLHRATGCGVGGCNPGVACIGSVVLGLRVLH